MAQLSSDMLVSPGPCGLHGVYHEQSILVVLVAGLVTGEVSAMMCYKVYPCYKLLSVRIPSICHASFYTHGETISDEGW